jgi:uncharacterized cupredoxin-like copper-binding protein
MLATVQFSEGGPLVRRLLALTAVLCAGAFVVGSGADAATTVRVTAGKPDELSFRLSKQRVPAGKVTFRVRNRGTLKHDFKIDGKRTKLLARNRRAKITVRLRPGRYRYLCTVPGHADGGMRGTLIVR